MGNPSVRRGPKTCEWCGRRYRPRRNYARARYCGKRCAALARPRALRVAAGRKGGCLAAARALEARRVTIAALTASLTPAEAFLAGSRAAQRAITGRIRRAYRLGYSAGYPAGYDAAGRDRLGVGA